MEENRNTENNWSWESATNNQGEYHYTNHTDTASATPAAAPPEKKTSGGTRVLAAVLAIALVVCACFGGYYVYRNQQGADTSALSADAGNAAVEDEGETVRSLPSNDTAAEAETADTTTQEAGQSKADKGAEKSSVKTTKSNNTSYVVTDVTEMVKNAMKTVVSIDNNYTASMNTFFGYYTTEATDTGTGVIIGKSDTHLLIVTNNHVVEGAETIKVHFIDDAVVSADIKGTNPTMDLAIISVPLESLNADTLGSIDVAVLGDSDALQLGEPVVAIGNALGYGQSVTQGIVSALNREIEMEDGSSGTFIQTDAAINPGNSGGALLNVRGEVIGINSSKIGGSVVEGMGFAIPITDAYDSINDMMNRDRVSAEEKGYFGISVQTPVGVEGAYVQEVNPESAAEKGGILVGDIITKVDGRNITSRDDLTNILNYYSAGTTIPVTVLRKMEDGYGEVELSVTLLSAEESGINTNQNTPQMPSVGNDGNGNAGENDENNPWGSGGWNWNNEDEIGGMGPRDLIEFFFGN